MKQLQPIAAIPSAQRMASRMVSSQAPVGTKIADTLLGRSIIWEVVSVPGPLVEKATMVYAGNERCQELLDARTLGDILGMFDKEKGNDVLAKGRRTNGIIETADGSRRRAACILEQAPYNIMVCDDLTDEEMAYLSEIGNRYNPTCAWERGRRYSRMTKGGAVSLREVEAQLNEHGEKVSRRTIGRCIKTSTIPLEVMRWFNNPANLSAERGEKVADNLASIKDLDLSLLEHDWMLTDGGDEPDETLIQFLQFWQPDVLAKNDQPGSAGKDQPVAKQKPELVAKEWKAGKLTQAGNKFTLVLKKGLSDAEQSALAARLEEVMQEFDMPPQLRGKRLSKEMYLEYCEKLGTICIENEISPDVFEPALLDHFAALYLEQGEKALTILFNIRVLREHSREIIAKLKAGK